MAASHARCIIIVGHERAPRCSDLVEAALAETYQRRADLVKAKRRVRRAR
jgi:hypothetical protein